MPQSLHRCILQARELRLARLLTLAQKRTRKLMKTASFKHHHRALVPPPNLQSLSSPPVGLSWTEPREGGVFNRYPHGLGSFTHLEGAELGR